MLVHICRRLQNENSLRYQKILYQIPIILADLKLNVKIVDLITLELTQRSNFANRKLSI